MTTTKGKTKPRKQAEHINKRLETNQRNETSVKENGAANDIASLKHEVSTTMSVTTLFADVNMIARILSYLSAEDLLVGCIYTNRLFYIVTDALSVWSHTYMDMLGRSAHVTAWPLPHQHDGT